MAENRKKNQRNPSSKVSAKTAIKNPEGFKFPGQLIYVIIVFAAILFWKSVSNDFVSWDDDNYILKNPYLKDFSFQGFINIFSNFYFGNYHPLTTLVYWVQYNLFALDPLRYHLVNVILHLLNVWLVYKLIEKLTGKNITAVIVSVLFAVHPMHVESVAWVSELKDVLYTSFFLLSLYYYLKCRAWDKNYFVSLLLFVLSLLSKSAAVTLPVVLIVIDFYRERKINIKSLAEKIPFLILSLLFGILAVLSQRATSSISDLTLSYSFLDRIFLVSYAAVFYIIKMVIPFGLSAMHYYPDTSAGSLPWEYYASLPFLILLTWFVLRRSSFRKELIFGAAFFIVVISVMLQIVPVGFAITAERYSYVSYIGLFFILGQWISSLKKNQKPLIIGVFIVAAIFSGVTWNRISVWKDGITLFSDVVEKNPESFHAYWIRGNMKNNKEDLKGALQDFNKSLENRPDFVFALVNRGDVRNKLFDYKGALEDLDRAVNLNDTVSEAYNNRGMAYDGLGDTLKALADYNKAIELNPDLAKAYNNRGVVRAAMGDTTGSLKDFNRSIELEPDEADTYSNRGNLKSMKNDFSGAVADYNMVLKLRPKDNVVYYNRGVSKFNSGDTAAACADWEKAREYGNQGAAAQIEKFCK